MLAVTQMNRNPWSVFEELESLQEDFSRAFGCASGDAFRRPRARRSVYPLLNVWSNDSGLVIDAELPGANAKDLDISVVGDELTLSGNRDVDEPEEGVTYHRRERGSRTFKRTVQLPYRADAATVKASYRNGVLRVTVPRPEADKPKRIAIES